MGNGINNTVTNNKQGKLPLWFIVIFSVALLLTLSTFGIVAYQQKQGTRQSPVPKGQFEILKQQILQQEDAIDTNWLHTLNPLVKKVRGRLFWSSKKQQGVMEFTGLPKLKANQQFHLLIYDLNAESSKPISAIVTEKGQFKQKSKTFLVPFTASTMVKSPFKFELMLEEEGVEGGQPLLLAQP